VNRDDVQFLSAALAALEVEIAPELAPPLAAYARLLWGWNERLNLTRHTTWEQFVARDLVDSLQLAALLQEGEEVLDVGSGGGVPGVVLAIARPDLDISLTESVEKRARVLTDIVGQLQLPVAVHHARAEDLLEDFRFDALVARAVGPLWKLCKWLRPHWPSVGRLLAVKGPNWAAERAEARHRGLLSGLQLRRAASYRTPGTDVENVILKIWPEP
jgi:16S rRNA (guanine527-N7)-methyltransferase